MADPTQLTRIVAVMLGVQDLPRALAFYQGKLNLAVVMQESELALLQCGNVLVGLSLRHVQGTAPVAGATELSFGVENLRATHTALGEKGIVFVTEPRQVTPTDWAVHFKDPDGHLLSLFGPEGKA